MGGSSSKPKDDFGSFTERIKAGVQDEIAKRAMLQREVEISVQIAKARDTVQIFGSAWLVLITGVVGARAMGHQVPTFAAIPVVVGGLVLGNMTDLAYGNKLQRVTREAERIMEHEKARFVPPKQVRWLRSPQCIFMFLNLRVSKTFPGSICEVLHRGRKGCNV